MADAEGLRERCREWLGMSDVTEAGLYSFVQSEVALAESAAYQRAVDVVDTTEGDSVDEMVREQILALATPSSLGALEAYVAERTQEDRALIEQIRTIISDTETQYGEFNISAEFAIEQIRAALSAKEQGK